MSKHISYPSRLLSTLILSIREGEGDPPAVNLEDPVVKAAIEARIEAEVKGLKAKNEELIGKNRAAADKLKAFDGIDPTRARELAAQIDNDEDGKLLAAGKKQEVINKHTERMRADYDAKLADAQKQIEAERARTAAYQGKVLENSIRMSIAGAGLHATAVEDALLHAKGVFVLDAEGNAVQLDSQGAPVAGKDGVTPFSPKEWIEDQKERRPHWFPITATGSGSNGTSDNGGGKTITRIAFEKLNSAEQAKVARSGVRITD